MRPLSRCLANGGYLLFCGVLGVDAERGLTAKPIKPIGFGASSTTHPDCRRPDNAGQRADQYNIPPTRRELHLSHPTRRSSSARKAKLQLDDPAMDGPHQCRNEPTRQARWSGYSRSVALPLLRRAADRRSVLGASISGDVDTPNTVLAACSLATVDQLGSLASSLSDAFFHGT